MEDGDESRFNLFLISHICFVNSALFGVTLFFCEQLMNQPSLPICAKIEYKIIKKIDQLYTIFKLLIMKKNMFFSQIFLPIPHFLQRNPHFLQARTGVNEKKPHPSNIFAPKSLYLHKN
ncbi:MAG: hypothetical protein L6U16_01555 [Porphyromonadaceae bacterium]|nr:MAG: hypothetical protein L6U16_01555 [Porphyromonadaceae bacterium]